MGVANVAQTMVDAGVVSERAVSRELVGIGARLLGDADDLAGLGFGEAQRLLEIHGSVREASDGLAAIARLEGVDESARDAIRGAAYANSRLIEDDGPLRWLDSMADAVKGGDANAQQALRESMPHAIDDLLHVQDLVDEIRRLPGYEPSLMKFIDVDPRSASAELLDELGRAIR